MIALEPGYEGISAGVQGPHWSRGMRGVLVRGYEGGTRTLVPGYDEILEPMRKKYY